MPGEIAKRFSGSSVSRPAKEALGRAALDAPHPQDDPAPVPAPSPDPQQKPEILTSSPNELTGPATEDRGHANHLTAADQGPRIRPDPPGPQPGAPAATANPSSGLRTPQRLVPRATWV